MLLPTHPPCLQLFRDLSDFGRRHVASRLTPLARGPGQELFSQGDEVEGLWLLAEGKVALKRWGPGWPDGAGLAAGHGLAGLQPARPCG